MMHMYIYQPHMYVHYSHHPLPARLTYPLLLVEVDESIVELVIVRVFYLMVRHHGVHLRSISNEPCTHNTKEMTSSIGASKYNTTCVDIINQWF